MDRKYFLDLAARGARFPIGADLVLREHSDHAEILLNGNELGAVVAEAARRYDTPLAIPLMDLSVEKSQLLAALGVPEAERDTYHLPRPLSADDLEQIARYSRATAVPRLQANIDAVRYVADTTDLVPCAMAIGPFSLMTKLLEDPITPAYMAGTGLTGADDDGVLLMETALEAATRVILASIEAQADAGARLCVIAEPAANLVYLSPKQLARGANVFDRLVMVYNRRVADLLERRGLDLFFHCCGELTDQMVSGFASLNPAVLSLGSSRKLWEDAQLVPKTTVLYGNLPTKRFFSDEISEEDVIALSRHIVSSMRDAGHPHILGSECDVLSVEGREDVIRSKVRAFLTCDLH